MNLFKTRLANKTIVFPDHANKRDTALFMHCNNGEKTAELKVYNDVVRPLLYIHGVVDIMVSKVKV